MWDIQLNNRPRLTGFINYEETGVEYRTLGETK